MTNKVKQMAAKLQISGVLEWRDKDGNILSTTELHGNLPLSQLGLTSEQEQQLIKDSLNGDHCN